MPSFSTTEIVIALVFIILGAIVVNRSSEAPAAPPTPSIAVQEKKASPFAVPDIKLPPPNMSKIFTAADLVGHDGSNAEAPIYVSVKGTVFDVTVKREVYGPGGGYHIFAGKDASVALGKSSLKAEDCSSDYSVLDEKEMKTLDDWVVFFEKRYPVVGKYQA